MQKMTLLQVKPGQQECHNVTDTVKNITVNLRGMPGSKIAGKFP